MFGFFRKNNPDEIFMADLASFAGAFAPIMNSIDDKGTEVILKRATQNYMAKDPKDAHFTAPDFYLDAFTGALFELVENGVFSTQDSLVFFTMTDDFLRNEGHYRSSVITNLMRTWQNMLKQQGAFDSPLFR